MLIPLRHENMEGRRWPIISISLIVINFLAFFATHWRIEAQNPRQAELRVHILLLAAMHPELSMNADAQEFVSNFREKNPSVWKTAASQTRRPEDAWDAKIRLIEDPAELQREMDTLEQQYAEVERDSIYLPNFLFPFWSHGAHVSRLGESWEPCRHAGRIGRGCGFDGCVPGSLS